MRVSGIGAMKPNTIILGFHDDSSHTNDLSSSGSQYINAGFENEFMYQDGSRISIDDYVGVIEDTLKLQKNICLCRHFQKLNRSEAVGSEMAFRIGSGSKKYIDVWPVNFLSSEETNPADNTSLFMFQLACILNTVPKWRRHKLRVLMCAREADVNVNSKEMELKRLLEVLRIKAETIVLIWDLDDGFEENDLGLKTEFKGKKVTSYNEIDLISM